MKKRAFSRWALSIVCFAEAVIIGVLALGTRVHGGDRNDNPVILSAEKQVFADKNWQYDQRERMYIQGQSRKVDICFLGDSITQRLEWQEYFSNLTVANRGIGSDTTLGAHSRLDSVIANKPKVISILLGINDLSVGRSPDEIASTYSEILRDLKESLPKAKILVSSILPVTEKEGISAEVICATNEKIKQVCAEYGITYVDASSVLADENRWLKKEYAIDTVHLTIEGYMAYLKCLDTAFCN